MHKVNHPCTTHYQEDVFAIEPEKVTTVCKPISAITVLRNIQELTGFCKCRMAFADAVCEHCGPRRHTVKD